MNTSQYLEINNNGNLPGIPRELSIRTNPENQIQSKIPKINFANSFIDKTTNGSSCYAFPKGKSHLFYNPLKHSSIVQKLFSLDKL